LERIRSDRPSLVFLDLRLPRMNGFQVLERLSADPDAAHVPVVVVTSSVLAPEDVQKLAHARAILSKAAMGRESLLELVATLALKE
jgi:CheY-like chemotaxis protein